MNLALLEAITRIRSCLHHLEQGRPSDVTDTIKSLDIRQLQGTLGFALLMLRKMVERDAQHSDATETVLIDALCDEARDWLASIGTET